MAEPRDNNPHSLRPHQSTGLKRGLCSCCELPFKTKPSESGRAYCDDCRPHYEIGGESIERREDRLITDRRRVSEYYLAMREVLDRNEAQLKQSKEQVSSALRSRDFWRAKVEAVQEIHRENNRGGCLCGARPCRTLSALNNAETEYR